MQLIKQRFSYFKIDLIRDNCMLTQGRPELIAAPEKEIFDDPFVVSKKQPIINVKTQYETIKLEPKPKKGPKTKYFYNDSQKEYVAFPKLTKEPCHTTNERHLKRHYGNPFASIYVITHERTIELRENKLYIRSYTISRHRDFNWRYYRKSVKVNTFTIDLDKGDFTIGDMSFGNMKTKRFRKNSFISLELLLNSNIIFNFRRQEFSTKLKIENEFKEAFNEDEFINIIKSYIPNTPDTFGDLIDKHDFMRSFIKFFVDKKKIKTPNDFVPLIKRYYPTEKFLKKNQRKLMQSILDSYGINSKFTLKLFHERPKLNLQEFSCFCDLLGKDYPKYLGSLKEGCIEFFMNDDSTVMNTPLELRGAKNAHRNLYIDKVDRENIIKILNSLIPKSQADRSVASVNRGLYTLLKDHFDMIEKIREYDPNIKMRATNYTDFHTEHIELSKTCSLIRKGWSIEYQYDNRMVRLVEEEIKSQFENINHVFNPVILKREEEYSEEGTFMHHCVASYANKESSMIISLRTNGGEDRVTCEFSKKTGDCIQERYFCNKLPPEYFGESLEILKQRVRRFAGQRLLNHIDVKKVKVKINGKEVAQREPDLFEQLMNGDLDF